MIKIHAYKSVSLYFEYYIFHDNKRKRAIDLFQEIYTVKNIYKPKTNIVITSENVSSSLF